MAKQHKPIGLESSSNLRLTPERLTIALHELDVTATPAQQAVLLEYLDQLLRWNKTYNLTAIRDPNQALIQHIFDSLSVVSSIRQALTLNTTRPPLIIDVGSGAGLPGAILSVVFPEVQIKCIDAVEKKALFIRQMAGILSLPNLTAQHSRIEEIEPLQGSIVISRAFASLIDFAKLAGKHVMSGGYLLAMKGREPVDEILALHAQTNWSVHTVEPLTVPELDAQRCLVWMQRKGNE
jgi:16S rRNA (guanine527-N7)-methyltransferase